MKLDINKKAIKKGLLYSSLALTCLGVTGFSKKDVKTSTSETTYEANLDNNQEEILSIDTIQTLKYYNEYLGREELDVNDLEVLANYGVPMIMVKSENGYSQVGEDAYVATNKNGDLDIVYSNMPGEAVYDMLTSEKLREGILYNNYESVIEFIMKNDIEPVGYALPYHVAYTESDMRIIKNIYGEHVADCAKEIGIPVKVYSANSFYEANGKAQEKVKSKK